MRLVGDCALACAFVSYCGPLNQDFRQYLTTVRLTTDLKERNIPLTANLDLTDFLADIGTIGDWNMAGLPTDPLSIQNGTTQPFDVNTMYPLTPPLTSSSPSLRFSCLFEQAFWSLVVLGTPCSSIHRAKRWHGLLTKKNPACPNSVNHPSPTRSSVNNWSFVWRKARH